MSIFMRLLTENNSTMNDNIQITSGYRADYLYRCRYKDNGELYDKRLMRCRPHDGFSLFKVVGNYPPFIEGWTAHRYFLATSADDAMYQYKTVLGWTPFYAIEVTDDRERKMVLSHPYYMP